MGFIYDTFGDSVTELWNLASKINHKPVHQNITWTYGIVSGRGHDFLDLQVHALALASSIIITEKVVPKIICCWDTPIARNRSDDQSKYYPKYLLDHVAPADSLKKPDIYRRETKYLSLHRSSLSVNPHGFSLGLGYRAKYLGLNYVKTPFAVMTDADTICLRPCVKYLMHEVVKKSDSFCWTAFWDPSKGQMNVGLNVYNMMLYNNVFKPAMNEMYWNLPRGDVYFLCAILDRYPDLKDKLKVELLDFEKISTGKYRKYRMAGNKTTWHDEKTMHYHGWKGEYRSDKAGFIKTFNGILTNLKGRCPDRRYPTHPRYPLT